VQRPGERTGMFTALKVGRRDKSTLQNSHEMPPTCEFTALVREAAEPNPHTYNVRHKLWPANR
jgi:hypothetical protein